MGILLRGNPSGKLPALVLHVIPMMYILLLHVEPRQAGSWDRAGRGQSAGFPLPAALLPTRLSFTAPWAQRALPTPTHHPPPHPKRLSLGGLIKLDSYGNILQILHFICMVMYPYLMKQWDADLHQCYFSQFEAKSKQCLHPCTLTVSVWS